MEFSVVACLVTWGVVSLQATVSFFEGTFLSSQRRQMQMSFLMNWAVSIGGNLLFPMINGYAVPFILPVFDWGRGLGALVVGLFISYFFHRSWWGKNENLGHVFCEWKSGMFRDLTKAGWVHFFFMALQTAVLLLFLLSPASAGAVWAIGGLLLAFVIVVNLQAHFVQSGVRWEIVLYEVVSVIIMVCFKLLAAAT